MLAEAVFTIIAKPHCNCYSTAAMPRQFS